jgi:hypothetical protein
VRRELQELARQQDLKKKSAEQLKPGAQGV